MDNVQILWGSTKLIIIEHTPDNKISRALRFVDECLTGQRGFGYSQVKRLPLYEGVFVREEIVRLKRERMSPATCKGRGDIITSKLAEYKVAEREYYQFDERAYRTLKSNYDKLKRCLELLRCEGEIDSYTMFKNGRLKVNYFTTWKSIEIKQVGSKWTLHQEHDAEPYSIHLYQSQLKKKLTERVFDLFNKDAPKQDKPVTGFGTGQYIQDSGYNTSGYINKPYVGKTVGKGEHDPSYEHSHYKRNIVWGKNGQDIELPKVKRVPHPLFEKGN